MRLILIRHAQTDLNNKNIYLGSRTNIDINKIGEEQALKTAEFLKNEKIDLIISSPLKRAMQTAQIINKYHNIEIKTEKQITERDFGEFEGFEYHSVDFMKIKDDNNYEKYGIESSDIFQKRVELFLDDLHKEHLGKTIVIVSHGGTLKMLLSILQKIPWDIGLYKIKKENASISVIEIDDKKEIKSIDVGRTEHLE